MCITRNNTGHSGVCDLPTILITATHAATRRRARAGRGPRPRGAAGDALRKLAMTLLCKTHREEFDGFFTAPLKPGRAGGGAGGGGGDGAGGGGGGCGAGGGAHGVEYPSMRTASMYLGTEGKRRGIGDARR